MLRIRIQFYAIVLLGLTYLPSAFAYIDPGTGGMIIGSLWLVIAGIFAIIFGFIVKYFSQPIKKWTLTLLNKISGKK